MPLHLGQGRNILNLFLTKMLAGLGLNESLPNSENIYLPRQPKLQDVFLCSGLRRLIWALAGEFTAIRCPLN